MYPMCVISDAVYYQDNVKPQFKNCNSAMDITLPCRAENSGSSTDPGKNFVFILSTTDISF